MPPSESLRLARRGRGLARGGGSGCALSDCWASDSNQRGAVTVAIRVIRAGGRGRSAGPDRGPLPRARRRATAAGALRLRVRLPVPAQRLRHHHFSPGLQQRAERPGTRTRRGRRETQAEPCAAAARRDGPTAGQAAPAAAAGRPADRRRSRARGARPRPNLTVTVGLGPAPASRRVSKTWSAGRPDQ